MPEVHVEEIKTIQRVFMQFERRSEKVSQEILARTFVDAEPLFIQLSSRNHQVLYGRRGTGKTHALKFLAEQIQDQGERSIYIDLRTVGSNGSIYNDYQRPLAERAARLVTDVLEALEQELMGVAVSQLDAVPDANQLTLRLDDLSAAIRTVEVHGPIEKEETVSAANESAGGGKLELNRHGPNISLNANLGSKLGSATRIKESGEPRTSIDFGGLQTALSGLLDVLGVPRIGLLIGEDESYVDVPPDDYRSIRRAILRPEDIPSLHVG